MEWIRSLAHRLNPEQWSALGTVVNAFIVVVLAIANFIYLKTAIRQAKAAESQASSALKQIEYTQTLLVFTQQQADFTREALDLKKREGDDLRETMRSTAINGLRVLVANVAPVGSDLVGLAESGHTLEFLPDNWDEIQSGVAISIPSAVSTMRQLHQSTLGLSLKAQRLRRSGILGRSQELIEAGDTAKKIIVKSRELIQKLESIDRHQNQSVE